MENTLKKINLNYFVVYLNLTQHCKSTILQFNKKLPFKTSKAEESLKVKQNKTNSSQVCKCWFLTIIDDIQDCNLLVWAPGSMSALIVDTGQIMLIDIPNPGFNKLSMHNY